MPLADVVYVTAILLLAVAVSVLAWSIRRLRDRYDQHIRRHPVARG